MKSWLECRLQERAVTHAAEVVGEVASVGGRPPGQSINWVRCGRLYICSTYTVHMQYGMMKHPMQSLQHLLGTPLVRSSILPPNQIPFVPLLSPHPPHFPRHAHLHVANVVATRDVSLVAHHGQQGVEGRGGGGGGGGGARRFSCCFCRCCLGGRGAAWLVAVAQMRGRAGGGIGGRAAFRSVVTRWWRPGGRAPEPVPFPGCI